MSRSLVLAALAAAFAIPAQAQEYFAGASLTSEYVRDGQLLSGGDPALQGFVEFQNQGFYAGTFLSTMDLGRDRFEADLSLGYRTEFPDGLHLDLNYTRTYFNSTGNCCGEFGLTLAHPYVIGGLGLKGELVYDHTRESLNPRGTVSYAFDDRLGFSSSLGRTEYNSNSYWDAGASWAFTDAVSADLRYHGADTGDAGVTLSLTVENARHTLGRLLGSPFRR